MSEKEEEEEEEGDVGCRLPHTYSLIHDAYIYILTYIQEWGKDWEGGWVESTLAAK